MPIKKFIGISAFIDFILNKRLSNPKRVAFFLIFFFFLGITSGFCQSFLGLDGGFEGTATIDNTGGATAASSGKWTRAGTISAIANETSTVRSGSNSMKISSTSTTLARIYSPQFTIAANTSRWVVQYYRRSASTTNTQTQQAAVIRNTTENASGTYSTVSVVNTWQKVVWASTTTTSATSGCGVILNKANNLTGGDVFIDDMIMYPGTAEDVTAPSSATAVTATQNITNPSTALNISWTAASGGVDNGGYLVVRYSSAPNADNDPNVNGIYAVGNTITNGTGALVGTVIYVGTSTTCTSGSLSPGTSYYYKVYTYDKAYNYAAEASATGTTLSPTITVSSANPAVAAANINSLSTKNPIYRFTAAVTNANATLSAVSFSTTNSLATDIKNYQLWYGVADNINSAVQIGSDITTSLGTGLHSFTGLSQVITSGTTGYFWITTDVDNTPTGGDTLKVSAMTTSNFTFTAGSLSGTLYAGGKQTIVTQSIVLSSANLAVPSGVVTAKSTKNQIYKFSATVNTLNATLNTVAFTTTNSTSTMVSKYQLWYKEVDSFSTATQIGSDITIGTGTGTHTFSGLTQLINAGSVGYFWITADMSSAAVVGDSVKVSGIATGNIVFASGTKTGTIYLGGTQRVISTPSSPTITNIVPLNASLSVAFIPPLSDSGGVVTNYQYSIDNGANYVNCSPLQNTSPLIISSLTNGVTYTIRIKAVNAAGVGVPSNSVSGTPIFPPVISSALSASSVYGTSSTYSITASNTPTSYNATGLPTGMTVNSSTGVISIAANTAVGSYTIKIFALNGNGTGVDSANLVYSVVAGAPSQLLITTIPNQIAGNLFSITVNAADAYGNPSNVNDSIGVNLTLIRGTDTLEGVLSAIIPAGSNSVSFNDLLYYTAEDSLLISATKISGTTSLLSDTSNYFKVLPNSLYSFAIEDTSGGDIVPQTINVGFPIKVSALDEYDNVVTGFNGQVKLTSFNGTLSAVTITSGNFTNGVWIPSVASYPKFTATGLVNLVATSVTNNSITDTSNTFEVGNVYYSRASGAWNSGIWSTTPTGSIVSSIRVSSVDVAVIQNGNTVTVSSSDSCKSLQFNGASATISINSGVSLTVRDQIILNSLTSASATATISGLGSIICNSVLVGNQNTRPSSTQSTTINATISKLDVSGNIFLYGRDNRGRKNTPILNVNNCSLLLGGVVNSIGQRSSGSNFNLIGSATLNWSNQNPVFNLSSVNNTGTVTFAVNLNGTSATVNFNGLNLDQIIPVTYKSSKVKTATALNSTLTYKNLTVSNGGTKTFAGTVNVTGTITIDTLTTVKLDATNRVNSSISNLVLNGGTLLSGSTIGYSTTFGTFSLTKNSIINLGTGVHTLLFTASNTVTWTSNKILTINGWSGTRGSSGTAGKIFIGTSNTGLTSAQLAQIQFSIGSFNIPAMILSTGEIVPMVYGMSTFTSSGTFVVPSGISCVKVEAWGAGGGGGSRATSSNGQSGGGGGGAYASSYVSVTSGASVPIGVGIGGAAGLGGGNSTFNTSAVVAAGGSGVATGVSTGALGGTFAASIGTVKYAGGNGGSASGGTSGGGGGGAGSFGTGGNASIGIAGIGTADNGGNGGNGVTGTSIGNSGSTYGGGGSGASSSNLTTVAGGSGASGLVKISWIDASSFSVATTSNFCSGNSSLITVSSSSLNDGTYTVTYNLSGANNSIGNTANMTFSNYTGSFSTITLANGGSTTITITAINLSGWSCGGTTVSSGNTAAINVYAAPAITAQPVAPSAVCAGSGSQTINVTATGTGLTYQWRKGGVNITNNLVFSGATSATLTISNPTTADTGRYDVVISGTCLPSVTSNQVSVSVNTPPAITVQPVAPSAVCAGSGSQTINVTATGTGLTYQWRKGGVNITNNSVFSGATSATLTISNPTTADTGRYDVVISGTCLPSVTSNQVSVSVNTAPVITVQPVAPLSVCAGSGSQTISVTATGTGLTYQWRKAGVDITNNSVFSGATSATLTISNPTTADTGRYDVVISGTCSPSITSNQVNVSVNTAPVITVQPIAPSAICPGNGTQTISITATGTGLTYQWRKNGVNLSNNSVFSGSFTSTLLITNPTVADTGRYDVVISGTCVPSVTSNQVAVTVSSSPVITVQPSAPATTCTGSGIQNLSVTATGSSLTYSWRKYGNVISNSSVISGQGTSTLTLTNPTLADVGSYDVVITGACGLTSTSNAITVSVYNYPSAPSAMNGSRCSSGTINISGTVGAGETIDWYATSTGGTSLSAGSTSYTTPSISVSTTYFAGTRNTTTGCVSSTRTEVVAIVYSLPSAPTGVNGSRCSAGSVNISATPGAGETIDWYAASSGGSPLSVSSTSYTTPSISVSTTYYAVSRNTTTGCESAVRTAVIANPNGVLIAPSASGASRCGAGSVVLSAIAGTGETIDWYSVSSGGSALVSSATSYTTPSIAITTTYYAGSRNITGGCTSSSRTPVVAVINNLPSVPSVTSNERCGSGSVLISATVSSGNYVNWYDSITGGTILISNSNIYNTNTISATTTYYVAAVNSITSCVSGTRVSVIATINSLPAAPTAINASVCNSGSADIAATFGTNETVDWYDSLSGGNLTAVSSDVYTIDNVTSTVTYYAVTRNLTSGCLSSVRTPVVATLTSVSVPVAMNAARCGTGTVTISATTNIGETIDWYSTSSGGVVLSSSSLNYTTPSISLTTTYYAQARNITAGCISSVRTPVVAQIKTVPTITGTTPASSCGTGAVSLSAMASAGAINWYTVSIGGSSIATGTTYVTPSLSGTTSYYVEASNNGCLSISRSLIVATIKVLPTITSTTPGSVCQNGTVSLSAVASAGLVSWYTAESGGTSIASGSNFTTPSLSNTTTYYAGASNNGCTSLVRTAVVATVRLNLNIAVSIVSSAVNNRICKGRPISFTATPQDGGTPIYQWKLNGVNVGTNSASFVPSVISDGDTVYVQMTSTLSSCNSGSTVISNKIRVTIDTLPHIRGINAVCQNNIQSLYASPPLPSSANTSWKSTNTSVAFVEGNGSNCNVSGLGVGQTNIIYSDNNGCADTVVFYVNNLPGNPTAITGPQVLCSYYANTSYTDTIYYHITPVSGASTYNWKLPKGARAVSSVQYGYITTNSGLSIDSSNVTTTADSIGLVIDSSLYSRYGGGWLAGAAISESQCASKYVGIRLYQGLPVIKTSSGPTDVCPLINKDTVVEYRINRISVAYAYEWQIPSGILIVSPWNSSDSNVIRLKFTPSYQTGNIRVRALANCGNTSFKEFILLRSTKPSSPSTIYGPTNVCNYYGNDSIARYYVNPVQGAIGYHWTLPASMQIVGATNDSSSIEVKIDTGFVTGSIQVFAYSLCAYSASRTLSVNVATSIRIGSITGPTNACMYYDTTLAIYSIRKVNGSPSYIWTVPSGMTIFDHPAGFGTPNDTIIRVRFNPSLYNFGSSIKVSSSLGCNVNLKTSLTITGSAPSVGGVAKISGPKNVCEFMVSNNFPNGVPAVYYINKVNNASGYVWSVPPNSTVTHSSTNGSSDTMITVIFDRNFSSGTITVNAINGCYQASSSNLISLPLTKATTVMPVWVNISSIGASNNSCTNRRYNYSISSLPVNATSLLWQVPSDVLDFTGQGTNTISVLYPPSYAYTGNISVVGKNNCSVSSPRITQVNLAACNTFIKGSNSLNDFAKVQLISANKLEDANIDIYPNPTTSYFNIKINHPTQSILEVHLLDMQGRIIQQLKTPAGTSLKIGEGLRPGCYFIEIKQGNSVISRKLMKI